MTAAGAKAELILPYERFLDRPEIYLAVSRARTQTSSHVLVLAVGVLRTARARRAHAQAQDGTVGVREVRPLARPLARLARTKLHIFFLDAPSLPHIGTCYS